MWAVESSRIKETLCDDEAQPARKTEIFSGSVAGEKEVNTGTQSTKNIEYDKRSSLVRSKTNINWNSRVTRRAGVSSAHSSERQKLESDLAVVIGSNDSTVRPKTAFDKFKTRTDARIFLKQSRYQLQQALRRKLNQEKIKKYKSSTSIPKGETVGNKHRTNDSFLTVTCLRSANSASSVDSVSKLLSKYNLNDHIVINETNKTKPGITRKPSQDETARYDARKVRDWIQMPTEKLLFESVSSGSTLTFDNVTDSEVSTIPFERESVCSGLTRSADRTHNNDLSLSGESLARGKKECFSEKEGVEEDVNDSKELDKDNRLNDDQIGVLTKDLISDCSQCVACKIEKIVASLSVVLANQLEPFQCGSDNHTDWLREQIRYKIREDMSMPEESVNTLEIHIRRLLAARVLDKNSPKNPKQKETKSQKSRDDDEQNDGKISEKGKSEESIGVLYAENVFKGIRKQSLSNSPLNISPKENQRAIRTSPSFSKLDGKSKKEIPYRFSYTHFVPSSSTKRVENREQKAITETPQVKAKTSTTKSADFGISLNIYRKRRDLEVSKTKKFILYPRNSGSTVVRQYRQDEMPERLGAWYWDRLEEIEKHRCPPPPNSPVPEEWADM